MPTQTPLLTGGKHRKEPKLKHRRAQDVWGNRRPILDTIFAPRTVAVIGASETPGSVGRAVMENLRVFGGTVFPVSLSRSSVLGVKAFRRIGDVPVEVDLAVIVTPAATVPGIIRECAAAGVVGAVIISAGFKEAGETGTELEREVYAARGNMRIIGPNCLGIMRPQANLNVTFGTAMARPGTVGLISQSGALCTAILDWSLAENVGFSAFISIGSMLDVGWGDLIYYLGDDPFTRSIVIYMETIGDAHAFLSAAREVALTKPIIVIKVGRSEAAARAAASHTGSLTGRDEVLDAAFRRAGVLRVDTIADLFCMAEILAKQPRPPGPRLGIVTNGGGPGALATDMLMASGGQLAPLSEKNLAALNAFLPPHWSHANPVDLLGAADAEQYAKAVDLLAQDPDTDGVLVILTPQAMTECTATAARLKDFADLGGKPILASWMGGDGVAEGEKLLNAAKIPTFRYPDAAARAFCYMWQYSHNLRALYETPALPGGAAETAVRHAVVDQIIASARKRHRKILSEAESKRILKAYGIEVVDTHVAHTEKRAIEIAEELGYPVVLKLHSHAITHKSDIGGVKLNLRSAAAVSGAFHAIRSSVEAHGGMKDFLGVTVQPMIQQGGYELILGSSIDPQIGPVLLFGAGGQLVEVSRDRSLGLPPLNATLARRMMERTRIYGALRGVRGEKPVDLGALEQVLVSFSHLVVEQPWIAEIDINPLVASPEKIVALDARMILHESSTKESDLPRPAIRPYPKQYVTRWKFRDGTEVTLRPIRPEDEPMMVNFHGTLSDESVRFRYFGMLKLEHRVAHERLTRICFNDYDREIALVAVRKGRRGLQEIVGVGRLSKLHGRNEGEWAIVISDAWQGQGLGSELLKLLIRIGRQEKLTRLVAQMLPENIVMQRIAERNGFELRYSEAASEWKAEMIL